MFLLRPFPVGVAAVRVNDTRDITQSHKTTHLETRFNSTDKKDARYIFAYALGVR